jgi:5-methylcytosine-specific restriction endonuclease McrA
MIPKGAGRRVDGGYLCTCEACGTEFLSRYSTSRACTPTCRTALWRAEHPDRVRKWARERARNDFAANTPRAAAQRAYNAAYKRRERARCSERQRLREAGIGPGSAQFVERVDRDVVYAMHGGCCGICRQYVAPDDFHVDHRIPLARGGLHGYVNCQPAHPLCNQRKYDKEG